MEGVCHAARSSSPRSSRRISSRALGRHCSKALRKPVDDRDLHRRRHRDFGSRRARRRAQPGAGAGLPISAAHPRAVSRSFQEIILAIFFVKLFGFGPFAGFITLIGRDDRLSTASCWPKTSRTWSPESGGGGQGDGCKLVPMAQLRRPAAGLPRMIGLGLYRLDINFRESAVVGIVGGGGIGATL